MWSQVFPFTLTNQSWNISFLGCYEAISEIQRRVGRDEKKKRGGGNRRVLVLIWEVKAKEVWPCPLWALSWNAMWTLRRQLLEPCQGPLTLRPFLFLCLCPQTQQCGRTCCLPPPLPQPQTSPPASPFLRFALILSLSLTCSLWHTHTHTHTRAWQHRGHLLKEGKINELLKSDTDVRHNSAVMYILTPGGYAPASDCAGPPSLACVQDNGARANGNDTHTHTHIPKHTQDRANTITV